MKAYTLAKIFGVSALVGGVGVWVALAQSAPSQAQSQPPAPPPGASYQTYSNPAYASPAGDDAAYVQQGIPVRNAVLDEAPTATPTDYTTAPVPQQPNDPPAVQGQPPPAAPPAAYAPGTVAQAPQSYAYPYGYSVPTTPAPAPTYTYNYGYPYPYAYSSYPYPYYNYYPYGYAYAPGWYGPNVVIGGGWGWGGGYRGGWGGGFRGGFHGGGFRGGFGRR